MTHAPEFILASASPQRRELLGRICAAFRIEISAVAEDADPRIPPTAICLANAAAKARAIARLHPHALVLGADTEVAFENRVFGKPADLAAAAGFLRQLAGRTHEVITGICLCLPDRGFERHFAETTLVTFHPLTDEQIAAYLRVVHPLDKAGAYAIQEHGDWIIESIHGSLSNVIGLPLGRLRRELEALPSELRPDLTPA